MIGDHDDLLVVHNMGRGCAYCTLWADGFSGFTHHFARRCAFVLCSDDEPETVGAFAKERGWSFRCVSGRGSDFTGAMGYRSAKGGPVDDSCASWPLFALLQEGANGFVPR